LPLFTEVPRRRVLGSPYAGWCISVFSEVEIRTFMTS
jgi:hypothetical protein